MKEIISAQSAIQIPLLFDSHVTIHFSVAQWAAAYAWTVGSL